jgi:two-component system response regulator
MADFGFAGFEVAAQAGVGGVAVDAEVRDQGAPVVVFTSSSSPEDVRAAYDAGAASYVVKPLNIDDRRKFAALLKSYWLETNLTPEKH